MTHQAFHQPTLCHSPHFLPRTHDHASYTLLPHQTDILPGASCPQPSLGNSYLSFLTQLQSHLLWESLPDPQASGSQSRLCPARAPSQTTLVVPITWSATFTFTSVLDRAGSSLGTNTPQMVPGLGQALIRSLLGKE